MSFPKTWKVKVVKQQLAEKHGLTVSEIKFICKGKVLKDHIPIAEYKLTEADVINLNLPVKEGVNQLQH